MPLGPAPLRREWMDATADRYAYRCLPLLIANQAGWLALNNHEVRVTWNGDDDPSALTIEYLRGPPPHPAFSRFGYGIVTWCLPYLIRTSNAVAGPLVEHGIPARTQVASCVTSDSRITCIEPAFATD